MDDNKIASHSSQDGSHRVSFDFLFVFLSSCWHVLCELAPWFILGAVLAGLIHGLAPVAFIKKRLQGYSGVLWAVLFGIPLPLCSCAVIPTGIGLRKSGASEGATVGFLIATPQTGVDSVFVTAALLGWPLAVFKLVVALVLGSVAGFVIEFRERARTKTVVASSPSSGGRSLSLPVIQNVVTSPAPSPTSSTAPPRRWLDAALGYARDSFSQSIEIIRSIYVWILLGVALSAIINVGLPVGSIQSWLGPNGGWLQVPVTLLLSLPLYVCATASVSVAAALVHSGLSVGATIVFLIAGPATNLATMGAILRSFGRGAFVTYMVTVVVGSVLAAYLFDWLIADSFLRQESLAADTGHSHDHHDSSHWLSQWSAILLLSMFAWFAVQESINWYRARTIGE